MCKQFDSDKSGHTYIVSKKSGMSASKVSTVRNGDVVVAVGGTVVKGFDDTRNRSKAATPKHEYVIGIAWDPDTKFNEKWLLMHIMKDSFVF